MSEGQGKQFISNVRVLDEHAFRELTGKLTTLIADAESSSRQLDELLKQTEDVSGGASATRAQLDQRLEVSARVLKITKVQLDRVERAVAALGERQQQVDEVSAELKGQLSDFHDHLSTVTDDVDKHVAGAVESLREQQQSATEAQEKVGHLLGAASSLSERSAELQAKLSGGIDKFQEGLLRVLADLENGQTQTQRASSRLDEQVFALKSRVTSFGEIFEDLLKPIQGEIEGWRKDASRAGQDLRNQFAQLNSRFNEAIQEVESRIGSKLADLGSRREGADAASETITSQLAELRTTLSDRVEGLERLCGELSEQTAKRLTPVVERLIGTVQKTAMTEPELLARFSELHDRGLAHKEELAAATEKVEGRVREVLDELRERDRRTEEDAATDRSRLAQTMDQLTTWIGRLQEHLSSPPDEHSGRTTHDEERIEVLSRQLGDLREQVNEVGQKIGRGIEPLLAAITERSERESDREENLKRELNDLKESLSAVADQTPLANDLKQLTATVEGLHEQMAEVIAIRGDGDGQEETSLNRRLDDLREQVIAVGDRIGAERNELRPQERDRRVDHEGVDTGFTQAVDSIQQQLKGRVTDVLCELEARGQRFEEEATTQRAQLTDAIADVTTNLESLQKQVVALAETKDESVPVPPGKEITRGNGNIERNFRELRELLSAVGARIAGEVRPALAELQRRELDTEAIGALLEEKLAGLRDDLLSAGRQVTASDTDGSAPLLAEDLQQLTVAVARLEKQVAGGVSAADKDLASLPRNLEDLRQEVTGIGERIGRELEPVLAAIERKRDRDTDSTDAAMVSPRLGEDLQQLTATVARLEERMSAGPVVVGGGGSRNAAQSADLERNFRELRELFSTVAARIAGEIKPVLAAVQQKPQAGTVVIDSGFEERLAAIEQRLDAAAEKVEGRLGEVLAELKARGGTGGAIPRRRARVPANASPEAAAAGGEDDAQRLVNALIDAVNTADRQRIHDFILEEYSESTLVERSVEDRIEVYMSFHDEAGEVELHCIEESSAEEIVAVVREKATLELHRLGFELDPAPPHKIMIVNIDTI